MAGPNNWSGLLDALMGEWNKTKQPLKERATMLPLGQYEDGSVGLAWPGLLADPIERSYQAANTPIPAINDDQGWADKSSAMFDATSLAPLGGVLGAVDNAVGSAGGKLMKGAADHPQGIRAYHGSPHDFDRFDLSKIGTGEGAQAYGHGLYFADSEDVARSYRDSLSQDGLGTVARGWLRQNNGDMDATLDFLRARASALQGSDEPIAQTTRQALAELEAAKASGKPPGRMYEVNIKANPEDFLDFDVPFAKQPPKVQEAILSVLRQRGNPAPQRALDMGFGQDGQGILALIEQWAGGRAKGEPALREAGVPGIKYLDQGSRGKGTGTSNYVVFDDQLIDILRKYANPVTGAIPGLAAQTQDGTDPQTITTANILKFLRGQ